jgi:sarcosine oxidase subunit beta
MGASVAWHLAQLGVTDVVLVERDAVLGAGSTGRNAGGVRHQFSHPANVRLSIESIAFLETFRDRVGAHLDLWQDGYLFLLSQPGHVDGFRRQVEMQRGLGVDVVWLTPDEAAGLAPGVRTDDLLAATYCARDGIADPSGLTLGLAKAARAAGVEIARRTDVTGIALERGRVASVETSAGSISTPVVVDAAGPWAGLVGALAGAALPVSPLRRHIIIAAPPDAGWRGRAPESRIMVIDFASTFYAHREGAGLLFGMGDPGERPGFDVTVRWEFVERITPVAMDRIPVLAETAIARAWAGLYEMTPDAMPLIGPVADRPGLFVIAGFSGHGFQHAPAAGRILADLIAGRDPGFDLSPFAPGRFAHGAAGGESNVI